MSDQTQSMPPSTVSRRRFLAGTSVATLSLFLGTRPASAGQAGPASLVIGSGEHTYEVFHDWLTPADYLKFGDTQGLAQDADGNIYVAHTVHPTSTSPDAIAVFDVTGKFVKSWGARFKGGAHGLDIRREGSQEFLYHCDTAHRQVVKTTLDGEVVWELGKPEASDVYGPEAPFIPTNVALAPNGDFYVTDGYGSNWIHWYSQKAEYLDTFGGPGEAPGQVLNPHGVAVDVRGARPELVVADRGNNRLQYLTMDGQHLRFVKDGMRRPCHFDFRNDLMLVPDLSSVVTILDRENKVVAQLGDGDPTNLRSRPRSEFIPGKFIHPHDAIFLKDGSILVAEWVPIGRVTLLRKVA